MKRRRVKGATICNGLTVRVFCRRSGRAEGRGSSVHSHHGERGAESVGLPQGGFISGHTELHQAEIPLGRRGETETFGSQSSEKGTRVRRSGATRQLKRHHGRNGEVQGNVSGVRLSVLNVAVFDLKFCFYFVLSWHQSSRSQSPKLRMLIQMGRKNPNKRMRQRSPPKQVC